jgi:hypothetical protein
MDAATTSASLCASSINHDLMNLTATVLPSTSSFALRMHVVPATLRHAARSTQTLPRERERENLTRPLPRVAFSSCAVLCCAVLCCAVLCCAVLCCAVLCCAVLCCARPWALSFAHSAQNVQRLERKSHQSATAVRGGRVREKSLCTSITENVGDEKTK